MDQNQRKINIAMICDPIGHNKSGVVVSTIRFAKLLTKRGHHVIFIGARSKKEKSGYHDGIRTYRFRSIPVPKSCGWNMAFPTVDELVKIFQAEKIQVVHIILPMSASIMAIKAAKKLGLKIVAHSHSQPENLFMDMPKIIQPTLNRLWNSYLVWTYNKASSLIYPSEMAKSLLEKLSQKNQQAHVISNGINTKEFQPKPIGDFFERFKIPEDTIKLLFVGRLFPEKSVETLIEAAALIIKKNPKVHLMIVGDGHLRNKLEKLRHNLDLNKHVTFLGLVSEEDKILAYNACDIFILPSLAELEGMVVLEAMACGKPIIISDAEMSASRFFVEDNGFLFKTKNAKDLADKIIQLANDKKLREQMGQKSLAKSQNYDIERSADKLEAVYYLTI